MRLARRRQWRPDRSVRIHLPTDVVTDQVERLGLFCIVSGGLWFVAFLKDAWLSPGLLGAPRSSAALLVETTAVLTAVAIYAYVCYSPRSVHHKADAGMWLMVLNCFDIALLETWARGTIELRPGQPSWAALVIVLSAMIMPSTPRKMTVAVLIAASMGPLGVWVMHLRGLPVPAAATTFLTYLPSYTAGIAAVLPSMMMQRLGRRLREARELGSYELVEQFGSGGMGEVWRARHRLLARDAAIKLMRPEVLGAGTGEQARQLLRRFEREAQATAQLNSAHSIRLFDFGGRRRPVLLRHGTPGRPRFGILCEGVRTDPRRSNDVPAAAGLPLARRSARARLDPSRYQTGQHLRVPDGARLRLHQGARFRSREGSGAGSHCQKRKPKRKRS